MSADKPIQEFYSFTHQARPEIFFNDPATGTDPQGLNRIPDPASRTDPAVPGIPCVPSHTETDPAYLMIPMYLVYPVYPTDPAAGSV